MCAGGKAGQEGGDVWYNHIFEGLLTVLHGCARLAAASAELCSQLSTTDKSVHHLGERPELPGTLFINSVGAIRMIILFPLFASRSITSLMSTS